MVRDYLAFMIAGGKFEVWNISDLFNIFPCKEKKLHHPKDCISAHLLLHVQNHAWIKVHGHDCPESRKAYPSYWLYFHCFGLLRNDCLELHPPAKHIHAYNKTLCIAGCWPRSSFQSQGRFLRSILLLDHLNIYPCNYS